MKGTHTGSPLPMPRESSKRIFYIHDNSFRMKCTYGTDERIWNDRLYHLDQVDQLRTHAQSIYKRLLIRWAALIGKIRELVHIRSSEISESGYYIKASKDGVCCDIINYYFDKGLLDIKYAKDEDLPTYVGRESELSEEAVKLLYERLKGPKASGNVFAVECQIRDDLVKEFKHLERRMMHTRRVAMYCESIVLEYLKRKYKKYRYNYDMSSPFYVRLTVNSHVYIGYCGPREDFNLIALPEYKMMEDNGDFGDYKPKEASFFKHFNGGFSCC